MTRLKHPLRPGTRHLTLVMVAVIVADQASKLAAARIGSFGSLIHPLTNPGLSLQLVDSGRWLETVAMTLGLVAAAAFAIPRVNNHTMPATAVALLLGGAASNLLDRAAMGSVRDFLVIGPVAVNAADLAVAAGLIWVGCVRRASIPAPRPTAAAVAAPSQTTERR